MGFDAIVVGLGGMGSAAAYHLARRGRRVLGIDQFTPAHDRGSSHGSSRIIRQAYHENPAYVPLVRRAYELWEQLERDSGRSVLQLTGGLMIGRPGSSVVEGTVQSARQHNLPYQVLNARELKARFPVLEPRPDETGVYEVRAGFVRPEAAVEAHLELAARHGAELHFEEPVKEWRASASGGSVRVTTGRGTYEAERLIVAPGAWAPALLPGLPLTFEIKRHTMAWFLPAAHSDGFLADRFPIYIWDVDGHHVFYGFPLTDAPGEGIKIAMHSGGETCTADGVDRNIGTAEIDELRGYMARFLPSLNGELVRAVTCLYTLTPDEHFVISRHPEYASVTIAAGFSGHGFKFTSTVGEVLAELAIEGATKQPIALFDPARFAEPEVAQAAR